MIRIPGLPLHSVPILVSLLGVAAVIIWRLREARSPVSLQKIVIPPLGMATGFSMFLVPAFRVPWAWAGSAFAIGAVALAYPLLATTRLVRQGDSITMQRSTAFISVILVLAAVRLLARGYLDTVFSAQQSGALLFVLAFGMILRWRMWMLKQYRSLTRAGVS